MERTGPGLPAPREKGRGQHSPHSPRAASAQPPTTRARPPLPSVSARFTASDLRPDIQVGGAHPSGPALGPAPGPAPRAHMAPPLAPGRRARPGARPAPRRSHRLARPPPSCPGCGPRAQFEGGDRASPGLPCRKRVSEVKGPTRGPRRAPGQREQEQGGPDARSAPRESGGAPRPAPAPSARLPAPWFPAGLGSRTPSTPRC